MTRIAGFLILAHSTILLSVMSPENLALLKAIKEDDPIGIRSALDQGARPDLELGSNMGNALQEAAYLGKPNAIKALIESGHVRVNDYHQGETALHRAVLEVPKNEIEKANRINTIDTLIALGADIESQNEKGRTALHLAAQLGAIDAMNALIRYGANVNALDDDDNTPAHFAQYADQSDRLKVLKTLKDANAKINQINKFGKTPMSLLQQQMRNDEEDRRRAIKMNHLDEMEDYENQIKQIAEEENSAKFAKSSKSFNKSK